MLLRCRYFRRAAGAYAHAQHVAGDGVQARARLISEVMGAIASADADDEQRALRYYEIIRAYIVHEDDLVNSRLTWSLTIHGFL